MRDTMKKYYEVSKLGFKQYCANICSSQIGEKISFINDKKIFKHYIMHNMHIMHIMHEFIITKYI